jgi:WD40 repeat protein
MESSFLIAVETPAHAFFPTQKKADSARILASVDHNNERAVQASQGQLVMVLQELEAMSDANESYTAKCEELEDTYLHLRVQREDAEREVTDVAKAIEDIKPTVEMLEVMSGALEFEKHELGLVISRMKGTAEPELAAPERPRTSTGTTVYVDPKDLRAATKQAESADKAAEAVARAAESAKKAMETTAEVADNRTAASIADKVGKSDALPAPPGDSGEKSTHQPRKRHVEANPFPRRKNLTPKHTGSCRCVLVLPFVHKGAVGTALTTSVQELLTTAGGTLSKSSSSLLADAARKDSYQIWIGCGDGSIRVWDSKSNRVIADRRVPSGSAVYDLCAIHQNAIVAAASKDGNVYLWSTNIPRIVDPANHTPSPASVGPVGTVGGVGFVTRVIEVVTTLEKYVWFGTIDGEIKVYSFGDKEQELSRAEAASQRKLLRTATPRGMAEKAPEFELVKSLTSKSLTVGSMLRRGHRVWVGTEGPICIWNSTTMKLAKTLEGHKNTVEAMAQIGAIGEPGADVSEVWTCSSDRTVRCWAGDTHDCLAVLEAEERVFALYYIPQFGTVWAGTWDPKRVLVYDARRKELARTEKTTHEDAIADIFVIGDNLYTASWDQNLCLWRRRDPNQQSAPHGRSGRRKSIAMPGMPGKHSRSKKDKKKSNKKKQPLAGKDKDTRSRRRISAIFGRT